MFNYSEQLYSDLTCPVFFVGFMGAGKSSVARRLARVCGVGSVDMDVYLERREGKRIKQIFAEVGEAGFRKIETSVLKELATMNPLLVSCGGGVIQVPENREILQQCGFVVHLEVDVDEARERISDVSTRPLFQNIDKARTLAQERLPLYREVADVSVSTAGKTVPAIAYEVRQILEKEGVLCQRQK